MMFRQDEAVYYQAASIMSFLLLTLGVKPGNVLKVDHWRKKLGLSGGLLAACPVEFFCLVLLVCGCRG